MANCIKCGKELSTTKVFCQECLESMEKYPVATGTPIVLHPRSAAAQKAPVKKKPSAEEQLPKLKKKIRVLSALLAVLLLVLAIGGYWLVKEILEPGQIKENNKGQNYSTQPTITTTPAPTTTPADSTDTIPPSDSIPDGIG